MPGIWREAPRYSLGDDWKDSGEEERLPAAVKGVVGELGLHLPSGRGDM